MQDFSQWSAATDEHFKDRKLIAFDMDDTLTDQGDFPSEVLAGLEALQKKKIVVCLVTGRSAGWADLLIKMFPFDCVIAENGALLRYWPRGRLKRDPRSAPEALYWNQGVFNKDFPAQLKEKRDQAAKLILEQVPGVALASDQAYRLYDLAIDFCEEIDPPLGLDTAKKIQEVFEDQLQATAKISSIHVNGWWGDFSKAAGLSYICEKVFSMKLKENVIYVGDSPNDASLFEAAGISVGVANIKEFVGKVDFHHPQYVCSQKSSAGALEVINALLDG